MSNSLPTIFIEGKENQQVSSHRHLGVVLSSQLRWSVHLRSVLLSASERAGLLRWPVSKDLPPDVIKKLYIYILRKASYGICFTCLAWFNHGRGGNRDGASAGQCRTLRIEITAVNSEGNTV